VAPLTAVSAEALDEALGLLANARRPLIVAGRGVVESEGRDALIELAEAVDAPLSTTVGAKDLFRGHARNIGVCGTIATSVGLEVIGQSDCIVAFGASMNQYTTDHGSLLGGKRVIQVDLDASQIARRYDVDISILGDARHVAEAMTASLRTAGLADGSRLKGSGDKWAEAAQPQPFMDRSSVDSIDLRAAMTMLDDVLPADRGLVTDAGRFMLAPWKYLPVGDPKRFVPVVNFGSIGLGLGNAIGASVADPDHLTVLVVGDGGMMMNIGELATAVRERLPLVVVVANDGAYGAEYRKLKEYGVDPAYSLNQWPDFADMARGFGCDAVTVRTATDIKLVKERVSELNGPLVVDVRIDPAVDISQ
jgi:thiamine pyrophosphate-dependent acetolactate synthase large subunit-like protein